MRKKTFIATFLLFVFSFILVHNAIPHHHHDEISGINNHELKHHHDEKNLNHHHHDDSEEHDSPFSDHSHNLASAEYVFSINNSFQKAQKANPYLLNSVLVINPTLIHEKRKSPKYISVIPVPFYNSTLCLRGPPTIIV